MDVTEPPMLERVKKWIGIDRPAPPTGFSRRDVEDIGLAIAREACMAGITAGDIWWLKDQIGWDRVAGTQGASLDSIVTAVNRQNSVQLSRWAYTFDAMSRQTIRVWINYCVGTGFAASTPTEALVKPLAEIWSGDENQCVFSGQGQQELTEQLLVDGNLFLALFGREGEATPKLRRLENGLEINKIVSVPGDWQTPAFYLREFYETADKSSQRNKWAYRALHAPDDPKITPPVGYELQKDVRLFHIRVNTFANWGNSLLLTCLPWAKGFYQFMQDRMAVERAIAQFPRKEILKGGADAVQAAIRGWRSGSTGADNIGGTGAVSGPPAAAGSTRVENQGRTLTPLPMDTAAGNAQTDGNMLIMTAGMGAGLNPIYYGAGEAFRLATATAMELPIQKQFEVFQGLIAGMFCECLSYMLTLQGYQHKKSEIVVRPPTIVQRDVPATVIAACAVLDRVPALAGNPDMTEWLLELLSVAGADEIVDALEAEPPAKMPPPPETVVAAREAIAALRKLRNGLEKTA
jgi:hypothetical protein